jgi:hypothetical protein
METTPPVPKPSSVLNVVVGTAARPKRCARGSGTASDDDASDDDASDDDASDDDASGAPASASATTKPMIKA